MSAISSFLMLFILILTACSGGSGKSSGNTNGSTSPVVDGNYPRVFSLDPLPLLPGDIYVTTHPSVLFSAGSLYRLDFSTVLQQNIIATTDWLSNVGVSPNNSYISYHSPSGGTVFVDENLNVVEKVQGRPQVDDRYTWTEDSRKVFWGDFGSGILELEISTGFLRKVLSSHSGTYDHDVTLSPNGKYMVWTHHEFGDRASIFVTRVADLPTTYENSRKIWTGLTALHDESLTHTFINDNQFIFKVTTEDSSTRRVRRTAIYLADAVTGQIEKKIQMEKIIYCMALSPDKGTLIFPLTENKTQIYSVDVGTWQPLIVDDQSAYISSCVLWSPDSTHFVIVDTESFPVRKIAFILYEVRGKRKWNLAEISSGDPQFNAAVWSN